MTKSEALAMLVASDHAYLTPKAARDIAAAFGIVVTMQKQRVDSRQPKGLTVDGVRDGTMVEGYDAASLAERIWPKRSRWPRSRMTRTA